MSHERISESWTKMDQKIFFSDILHAQTIFWAWAFFLMKVNVQLGKGQLATAFSCISNSFAI